MNLKVKLLALTDLTDDNEDAHLYVGIKNYDKKTARMFIHCSDLASPSRIKSALLSKGLPVTVLNAQWKEIAKELERKPRDRVSLASRPGWIGTTYLLPDNSIIGPVEKYGPLMSPKARKKLKLPTLSKRGSLKDWQENVLPLTVFSNRLIHAVCAAFSGPIVRLVGMEPGGFHFFGRSSTGKTTALTLAASVFGGRRFGKSWNITLKSFEEVAEAYNDSTLILDELALVELEPTKAAQKAMKIIYEISQAEGMHRSVMFEDDTAEWGISILSAGEWSLYQLALQGNREQLDGEKVRIVDIPADAGKGYGIFDSVPEGMSSLELINKLTQTCQLYHGAAYPAFVQAISDCLVEGRPVERKINEYMGYFLNELELSLNEGINIRIAKRFAFAFAAGMLARKLKILTYTKKQILNSVMACYHSAIINLASLEEEIDEIRDALIKELKSDRILDLHVSKDISRKAMKNASGYVWHLKRRGALPIRIVALKPEILIKLIPGEGHRKAVLADLADSKILVVGKDGGQTRQISYKFDNNKKRFYCFNLDLI